MPTTALFNGRIYTVDPALPWAEAVLIADGRFAAVGTEAEVRSAALPDTDFIDLQGRMAMPGLHDAHTHLLMSGLRFNYEARLTPGAPPAQLIDELKNCHCDDLYPEGQEPWIIGGEYWPQSFGAAGPDRAFLDEAFPDQPVVLTDYSIHHGLANARALSAAGVNERTPDPVGGRIVRRPGSDELSGELVETALSEVGRIVPDYRPDVYRDALAWAVARCHEVGITSVQEASASPQTLEACGVLDHAGDLNLHVAAHLVWGSERFGRTAAQLERVIAERECYATEHVGTDFIKIWLDGAPLPPHMTQAELAEDGSVDPTHLLVAPETLTETIRRFDEAGLKVKIHCAGRGSIRSALDAFAAVRAENPSGPKHEIAHCTYIHDDDYPRFAELGIIAEMSPALWHVPEYGLQEGYKFRTILDAGAAMTVGSDWVITASPNLFPAIQGMLQWRDDSIDLPTAIKLVTIDGARAVGAESMRGSITAGKLADLIVLDRNIFEVPVDDVGGAKVLTTYFEGSPVYTA